MYCMLCLQDDTQDLKQSEREQAAFLQAGIRSSSQTTGHCFIHWFAMMVPALPKESKAVPLHVQLVEEQTLSRWQRTTYEKTSGRVTTLWH